MIPTRGVVKKEELHRKYLASDFVRHRKASGVFALKNLSREPRKRGGGRGWCVRKDEKIWGGGNIETSDCTASLCYLI